MMELPGRQRSLTISSAVWMECTNVTDRRSRDGTGRQQWPRLRIASRGKTGRPYISFRKSWFSHFLTLWPWDLQNRASRGVAALCQVCFDWLLRFGHSVVVTCNGRVTIMVCSFWVVLADSGGERWPHRVADHWGVTETVPCYVRSDDDIATAKIRWYGASSD